MYEKTQAQLVTLIFLCILFFMSAIGLGYVVYEYKHRHDTIVQNKAVAIKKETNQFIKRLETELHTALGAVHEFVDEFARGTFSYDHLEEQLKTFLVQHRLFSSTGVAYASHVRGNGLVGRVFYYNGEVKTMAVEDFYDYTKTPWYTAALNEKTGWFGPYTEPTIGKLVVRYVVPLYVFNKTTKQQEKLGAITLDLGLDTFNNFLESIGLGKQSYTLITSSAGQLLVHPDISYVHDKKYIADLAREKGKKDFLKLSYLFEKTSGGDLSLYDEEREINYDVHFETIPSTRWVVVMLTPRSPLWYSESLRRPLINIFLALIFFLTCLFMLLVRAYRLTIRSFWLSSSFTALLITMTITGIWTLELITDVSQGERENIINGDADVQQFFFVQRGTNSQLYQKNPLFIPTGLFITSFDFAKDNKTMTFNGYVWQKYPIGTDIKRGVTVLNAEEESYEQIYEQKDDNYVTVGWKFQLDYSGTLLYTKYPFDQQSVALNISYIDYQGNVILTPDFDAFSVVQAKHPELDPDVKLAQWTIKKSFFYYTLSNFMTDFGITDYIRKQGFPFLYFNLHIQRNFLTPFVINFLPVIIIIFIIFSILLIIGMREKKKGLAQLVIGLCSSIFFAAAVAHQTFQRTVQTQEITYFEYFFFLLYAVILLTAINGMLYGSERGGKLISYKKNLLPRLLYWPTVLGLILMVTLVFFY